MRSVVVDGIRRVKGTPRARASLPAPATARQPIQAGGGAIGGTTSPATPPVLRTPPRREEHTHTLVRTSNCAVYGALCMAHRAGPYKASP